MSAVHSLRAVTTARPYVGVAVLAGLTTLVTLLMAAGYGLPLRDPDGVAGPSYVRLPAILAILWLVDILPRGLRRAGGVRGVLAATRAVARERWPRDRVGLALLGLISFYLTYVSYRNLKSFLPFAREGTWDIALLELDRELFLGADPGDVLHTLLGTGVAAHVLSAVYVFFLIFVPLSLAAALVWFRDMRNGYWYVTAMCVCWVLGALSYYVLPSLGPIYASPGIFADLPVTAVSQLQDSLWQHRVEVMADPHATHEVHGIAGFASLHVAIVLTAAWIAQLAGVARAVRWTLWGFFALTAIATIYFGWHYLIDDLAGVAIAAIAVWVGAQVTGNDMGMLVRVRRQPMYESAR